MTTYRALLVAISIALLACRIAGAQPLDPPGAGDDPITTDALEEVVKRDGRAMLAGIFFDTDNATIKAESQMALEAIAGFLKSSPKMKFFVTGHTDATGSYEHNVTLSGARAAAVATVLIEEYGISASRLMAVGVGPVAPVAANDTPEGRARNRRVELVKRIN